jgi:hypothetical protein
VSPNEVVYMPAQSLFGRIAEELGCGWVPFRDNFVPVHHDHGGRTDLDERCGVFALPLHLGEEARVLDRHADVRGDRREQPRVGLAEPAFLLDALDADHPDRRAADEDRHSEVGARGRPDARLAFVVLLAIEEERLA